jgi:hypothetical protein
MKIITFVLVLLYVSNCQPLFADETPNLDEITVYRSASCGCCEKWLKHLEQNQFKVKSIVSEDMPAVKAKFGVPKGLASCHTALIGRYLIEGHVPATDIKKLLQMQPDISGIAAPGMPVGSPGMEMNGQKQAYQVISFDKQQHMEVFVNHND